MGRRMAHHSFKGAAYLNHVMNRAVRLVFLAEFLADLQSPVDSQAQFRRHELHKAVDFAERNRQGPADVAHDCPGSQRSESDDQRHVFLAVLARYVVDDAAAVFIAEIHVDIGHRHPFRIEEPFKEEVVFQRVQPRNPQQIRYDGARRRAAARADGDIVVAGKLDIVPYDEEVRRKAHLVDDVQLVIHAFPHFRRHRVVPRRQGLFAELAQVRLVRLPFGNGEFRQMALVKGYLHIALIGDFQRRIQRFRHIGKQLGHFVTALHVKLVVGKAEMVRVFEGTARRNA